MKFILPFLILPLSILNASAKDVAISTKESVIKKKATVEAKVNRFIKKMVGNQKLPLDFSKLSCIESGDEVARAGEPLTRLGICLIKGDAKRDPNFSGSFAILVSDQGITVHRIAMEME